MTGSKKPQRRKTASVASDRALARLIRFALASGPLQPTAEGALRGLDGTRREVMPVVVAEALRRGLVQEGEGRLKAAPTARAFLRRHAAELEDEAFQAQHRDLSKREVRIGGRCETVRVNLAESPLGPLARLKDRDGAAYFSDDALAAGERLAREFERAGLQPRITSTWEPRLSQAPRRRAAPEPTISDSAAAARKRLGDALDMIGPDLAGVALDVCCFGKGLELVERERQWPARSAKLMLRTALCALSRHYAPPQPGPRTRHWGAEGYRPEL
ncbi:DUF6456 domain-containing protein [Ciceribacter sp. L1K23]|uniref:DUF6456 domain-containing protein n=1 Tax=Ciceribacter sp. L1K23 TaxID=2820276 RepID=UPI002013822A|nr:DUF6456 domain-containing protein [Ciceribacter sp. L1K23]